MQLHKHNQTTFGSKSTFEFPQETPQAVAYSRGKPGTFARLRDKLYLRGRHGGFHAVPDALGQQLIRNFEARAARIQRIRYALAILAGVVLGTVVWMVM
jgi:hypothetical protein